jgi:hypothetical protein
MELLAIFEVHFIFPKVEVCHEPILISNQMREEGR